MMGYEGKAATNLKCFQPSSATFTKPKLSFSELNIRMMQKYSLKLEKGFE